VPIVFFVAVVFVFFVAAVFALSVALVFVLFVAGAQFEPTADMTSARVSGRSGFGGCAGINAL
jgi:hypothetical protein